MEGRHIQIACSLQSLKGGRLYAKNPQANTTADQHYIHSSRLKGEVRFYASLDKLVADCDFKDARDVLEQACIGTAGFAVAEDTKSGLWFVLKNPADVISTNRLAFADADGEAGGKEATKKQKL